ncbi:hypothetical protein [Nevskia ramosa]|uniref:hypothetical protein n=1 Tax=Nevskia ramosa TaxID=64002 RepID=UPI0023550AEB|nr:hypothetical protein [Nevskia ramosa]
MVNLELSFRFLSPITRPGMPIHLDAVLLYANIDAGMPEAQARALLEDAVDATGEGENRVYCASALLFDVELPFTRFATQKLSTLEFARAIHEGAVRDNINNKVDCERGSLKGRMAFIPMMWAPRAKAWLRCKSPEALNTLLANVQYVGKYSNNGYGQVGSIEPVEAANPDAWQRRILPFEVDGAAQLRATTVPPYWDRTKARNAFMHPDLISGQHGVFG